MRPANGSPSEILDRLPPADAETERQVLGAILLQPKVLDDVSVILKPGDFYSTAHAVIYRRLVAMADGRHELDLVDLRNHLLAAGELEQVGGSAYLAEVMHSVAVWQHATHHAEHVATLSRYRRMIHAGLELLRDAYAASDRPGDIASRAEAALSEIDTGEFTGEPQTAADCAREAMAHVDQIMTTGQTGGVMIGLPKFDTDYGGLFPGELTILAARPRIGKTALGRQIARHVGGRGKLVLFASCEMLARDLTLRDLTAMSDVSLKQIRTGRLGSDDRKRLVDAANEFSAANVLTQYRPSMNVRDVYRTARRLVKRGLSLVIVDYLQRLEPDKADAREARYVKVGKMAGSLKTMAGDLKVPVLCLCQVGREVEKSKGKKAGEISRPSLADLRESGDIEAHADNVLFLHRQVAGWRAGADERKTELLIDKYRNGPTGAYQLEWDGERMTLSDPRPSNYEPAFDSTEDF
jgi:replicative DNA helicase